MRKIMFVLLPIIFMSLVLAGCGSGASETKPIAEVKTEAQAMSADQLKATVAKYQTAIESKKAEISKLTEEIKKIPIAQAMGDEAKKLRADLQNVGSSVRALTDRLNIYAQQLKSKMHRG